MALVGQKRPLIKPRNEALKPVIYFYKYQGGWSRAKPEMTFAAWSNGEVIWREPQADFMVQGNAWGKMKAHYYKGRVSPKLVNKELARLAKGAAKAQEWMYEFPDAQVWHRMMRYGATEVDLGCSAIPPKSAPKNYQGSDWKAGLKMWHALGTASKDLRPKVKKEIKAPTDVEIASWF